jgi:hypothetical protein
LKLVYVMLKILFIDENNLAFSIDTLKAYLLIKTI